MKRIRMPPVIALLSIDLLLFYETDLKDIREKLNKIMEQNRVEREHFDKKFGWKENNL